MTDSVLPISTEIASDKSRKRSGGCRSEWWEHFSEVIVNGMKIAQCKYCSSRYAKNGTGNMKTHMLTKHSNKMAASNQPTVDPTNVATPDAKFDNERSMQLLIRFVVSNNHPFSMIEESSFKDLIESLQPNMKLTSSASLKARIIASEWKMKAALINYLQNRNIGTPSASVDLHIAKDVSIMAVTVSWVDEKFILREIVVGFRQIIGDRCAVNLSRMLLEVLEDFSIRKVLCITAVDANSNGTLVDELVRQTVNFDVAFVKDHWISCLANIVHLAAQEALDRIDPLVSKLRLLAKIIDECPRRRQKLKSALLQSGTDLDREKILAPDVPKRFKLQVEDRALTGREGTRNATAIGRDDATGPEAERRRTHRRRLDRTSGYRPVPRAFRQCLEGARRIPASYLKCRHSAVQRLNRSRR